MTIDISKFCGGGFPRAWREGDTVYATNDGRVATRYANLIRTLRDVQWGVVGEDALGPVYFRWPRGRGAVATIRQDGDQ